MTKPKAGAEARASKEAGILLRAAITKQLREGGPQTALEMHAVLGGEFETVREGLYRMCKAGAVSAQRGVDRTPSTYCLAEQKIIARNVAKPFRPVVKQWEPNHSRDRLHCFLFGVPAGWAAP